MIYSLINILSYGMVSKLIIGVTTFILISVMTRESYARYTYAISIIAIVTQSITIAFNRIYIISIKDKGLEKKRKSSVMAVSQVVLSTLVLAVLQEIFIFDLKLLFLIWLLSISIVLLEYFKTMYQEKMEFKSFSRLDVFRSSICFLLLAILLALDVTYITYRSVLLINSFAILFIVVPLIIKKDLLKEVIRLKESFQFIGAILFSKYKYLFGYMLFLAIFSNIDVLMLEAISDSYNLAAYGSAFRYYNLLLMFLGAAHAILLPYIAKADSREQIDEIYRKHRIYVYLYIPVVIVIVWLSQYFMPLIDGGKYPAAIPVFWILAASSIISLSFSPYVHLNMRHEKYMFLFVLMLIGTFLNFTLNIKLIDIWGAKGAAIATLISYGFVNTFTYLSARRLLNAEE